MGPARSALLKLAETIDAAQKAWIGPSAWCGLWLEALVEGERRELSAYNEISMKARVYVSLKATVLDPQGQTICSALNGLGHRSMAAVRQGKFFDITIADGADRESVRQEIEQIAHDVLANPVIEEYRVEILD